MYITYIDLIHTHTHIYVHMYGVCVYIHFFKYTKTLTKPCSVTSRDSSRKDLGESKRITSTFTLDT